MDGREERKRKRGGVAGGARTKEDGKEHGSEKNMGVEFGENEGGEKTILAKKKRKKKNGEGVIAVHENGPTTHLLRLFQYSITILEKTWVLNMERKIAC